MHERTARTSPFVKSFALEDDLFSTMNGPGGLNV
jgi:hypothetical protein